MARNFRTVTRGRRQVRETLWLFVDPQIQALAAASTAVLLGSLNTAALALRPFTIVRTRGFFGVRSDQVATSENYDAAVGYAVVSDQAAAVGVSAVPTPETDRGSDLFFVYESLMGRFQDQTAAGFHDNALTWIQFDSKAMRKVDDDSDLVIVIESSAQGQGQFVSHSSRILIKLH